jgi:hypothetical protein
MAQNGQEFFSMYSAAFVYGKLFDWLPGAFSLQKWCRVIFPGIKLSSKGGLDVGVDSSLTPEGNSGRLVLYSTPEAALQVEDDASLLYLHLLYALRDENLGALYSDHGAVLLRMLEQLEDPDTRLKLLSDLETGTIGPHLDLPLPSRIKLEAGIKPDRRRAAQVRAALLRHDARGRVSAHFVRERTATGSDDGSLVSDLWPSLHCVVGAMSGPYSTVRTSLRRRFLPSSAKVPVFDPMLLSTEALIGGNVAPFDDDVPPPSGLQELYAESLSSKDDADDKAASALRSELLPHLAKGHAVPSDSAFLVLPQSAFFEFIPEGLMDEEQPSTRLLHELRPGERYEVVVTSKGGLWRYRTGDVVRVVGLEQGALPLVQLLYRDADAVRLPAVPAVVASHDDGAGESAGGRAVVSSHDVLRALRLCEASWAGPSQQAPEAAASWFSGWQGPTEAAAASAEGPPGAGGTDGRLLQIEDFCVLSGALEGPSASRRLEVAVELSGAAGDNGLTSKQQAEFEARLSEVSAAYRAARAANAILPAHLLKTERGTFARHMRRAITPVKSEPLAATPAALYKPPRLCESINDLERV